MSRDLPAELDAAIEEPVVRPFLALFIDFPDPVRVWTGTGNIIFEGEEWIGAGGVGAIDTIGEGTDGSAVGIKASLFNVPSEFRDDIADQATKGATFEVWVGALNETFQVVEAVKLLWKGRSDTYEVVDGGETLTVNVTGESRMRDQRRPAIKRFTNTYQQSKHPGDLFFEYADSLAEVSILWAKASQGGPFASRTIGSNMTRVRDLRAG